MPSELATTLAASEEDRLVQAEALVRAYCGWHIAPVKVSTWSLGPTGDTALVLPTLRLVNVLAVVDRLVTLDPAGYTWDEQGILHLTARSWYSNETLRRFPTRVTVQAEHGYDEPPAEVTAVVQAVAQRALDNPGSLTRDAVGPFANVYSASSTGQAASLALLIEEKQTLGRYKLPART